MLDELPAKVVRRFWWSSVPERRVTAQLLGYAPETAGRLMTTEYIDLKEFQSAAHGSGDRSRRVRETPKRFTALYVTDAAALPHWDLVPAGFGHGGPQSDCIGDVMTREVLSVATDTDQEKVARARFSATTFLAVPVVDSENVVLVGIVTVDDVIDVIEQEATRDLYAAGAVQAGDEDDYFSSNLFTVARRRDCLALSVLGGGEFLHNSR